MTVLPRYAHWAFISLFLLRVDPVWTQEPPRYQKIGREVAVSTRLADGDEYSLSPADLVQSGRKLFNAMWTWQEGAGRPLSKGTGDPVSDINAPLTFPRNFNRVSGPDANSCFGCHNQPFSGGGGDFVTNVFVLGQRFDFVTFGSGDPVPTRGAVDERGQPVTLETVGNSRHSTAMFGAGYLEMLARQMTATLQLIRDLVPAGGSAPLIAKGIEFGTISRDASGLWDVSRVEGISPVSLVTTGPSNPPSLVIRPWHQAGRVVSLREFSNNAFNHHHGIQTTERFGIDTDPDGDGVRNEMSRAEVTAASIFQATLQVPVQVISSDPEIREAVQLGEARFDTIGCAKCHISRLPLDRQGWIYTEPNPYNPAGNLRLGDAPSLSIDLSSDALPAPRLKPDASGIVWVAAFTDFKLHDICSGEDDPNIEPLDMQKPAGTEAFFARNRKFLTKRLWGVASTPPYFHHGKYTTMREAVLAHAGEALEARQNYQALPQHEQDALIEFLKSLRLLNDGLE